MVNTRLFFVDDQLKTLDFKINHLCEIALITCSWKTLLLHIEEKQDFVHSAFSGIARLAQNYRSLYYAC